MCRAVLAYEGGGRELVARLKYRNARATLGWLAAEMAILVDRSTIDAITWIPTTTSRRRQRGFDQAQLLAKGVSRRLRLPCRRLLIRAAGAPQTGRTATERLLGPILAVRTTSAHVPRRVLLVDDVVTTGSTATAAARVLKAAGADQVVVIAAARTALRCARLAEDAGE